MKKNIIPVLLSTAWISASEFIRNTYLLHQHWIRHFNSKGLIFPEQPVNGALWGIWSLCYAITIFILIKKYTLLQTTLLSWLIGFVMMWLVIGNLGMLPLDILPLAIPLSLLESWMAAFIIKKISK